MQSTQIRVFEQWEGNERFFCGGRLIAGPNWKSLLMTSLLIVIPLVVYLVFVGRFLTNQAHFSVPLISLVLGIISLVFLFTTGCMDPGILPRQRPDEEYLAGRKPKNRDLTVNGHQVSVRYNETCHFYQPPRAHHCSVNDNCIEKFDHHCPWVGTTIGLRNYRFFLLFIFTASMLCLYVISTGVLAVKLAHDDLETDDLKIEEAIEEVPAAIAISAYCLLGFLFVGGLSFFHVYLVSTNQTTYENFRYSYSRSQNPYNQGCVHNCWSVWCTPIPRPKVKFRSYVQRVDPRPGQGSYTLRPIDASTSGEGLQGVQDGQRDSSQNQRATQLTHEVLQEQFRRVNEVPTPPMTSPSTEFMEIQVISNEGHEPGHQLHRWTEMRHLEVSSQDEVRSRSSSQPPTDLMRH